MAAFNLTPQNQDPFRVVPDRPEHAGKDYRVNWVQPTPTAPMPGYTYLETKGRKTGKPRRTPVGDGCRARHEGWRRRQLERDPHVRLKLRKGLSYLRHTGTAHILSDDDPRERQRWLAKQLPSSAGNATAVRFFGTQLLSIRVDLDR